ncbi:MAG TPA: hypothetical protein VGV15_06240 [Terriglobales bacterium]|nr:hypothetical protein [Terriglobales bacterium]
MSTNSHGLVFLESLAGYLVCIVVALFALLVLWRIFDGTIDLRFLLSEKDGEHPVASMSRFQLLIFIFVIALSFFLIVFSNVKIRQTKATPGNFDSLPGLPEVPNGVLGLLGISASSYAVSKAIQHGAGKSGNGEGGEVRAAGVPGGRAPEGD